MSRTTKAAIVAAVLGLSWGWGWAELAKADEIELKLGNKIQGLILPGPQDATTVQILTARSSTLLKVSKDQILSVTPKKDVLAEYQKKLKGTGKDAESHFSLGIWCEASKLSGPAKIQFEQALEIDPNHAGAHERLGHVYQGGQWLTEDQAMEAKGFVRHKGRWVGPEEKARLDARQKETAEQAEWGRRIKVWTQQFRAGDPRQTRGAQEQLLAINEQPPCCLWLKPC